jgi:hypothetical protein
MPAKQGIIKAHQQNDCGPEKEAKEKRLVENLPCPGTLNTRKFVPRKFIPTFNPIERILETSGPFFS